MCYEFMIRIIKQPRIAGYGFTVHQKISNIKNSGTIAGIKQQMLKVSSLLALVHLFQHTGNISL